MALNRVPSSARSLGKTPENRGALALAFAIPAIALGGAYISQYVFGLLPCEMCWWQRWPHFAALAFAAIGLVARPRDLWLALAGLAIVTSGVIGAYHAGVEYGWWDGLTSCATVATGGGDPLEAIMNAPLIRCDAAAWTLFGISLAGFNFLFSTAGALVLLALLKRKGKR